MSCGCQGEVGSRNGFGYGISRNGNFITELFLARFGSKICFGPHLAPGSESSGVRDLLGVSRTHLIKLLKNKALPYTMVGSHRRIKLTDLLDNKKTAEKGAAGSNEGTDARKRRTRSLQIVVLLKLRRLRALKSVGNYQDQFYEIVAFVKKGPT